MALNNREIESKLLVEDLTLDEVNDKLADLLSKKKKRVLFGSSLDTYWQLPDSAIGDFVRVRERDGIRQITVKARDKCTTLNRLEIDLDSTSDVSTIHAFMMAAVGPKLGTIEKSYYVYWVGKHDTICCYTVKANGSDYHKVVLEIEASTMKKMLSLEKIVKKAFKDNDIQRAPGSLYEMFLKKKRRREWKIQPRQSFE